MSSKKVLVISVHSDAERLGLGLAAAYADAATAAGHNVRWLQLDKLNFNPVFSGYAKTTALEPDLQAAQADLLWAEHISLVYPIWWGSVPALLKGFLDRVLLPGFAFKYQQGEKYPQPLLVGKTAHLLLTMDTPPWYFRWIYRAPGLQQISRTTLAFCGIKPLKSLMLGPVISSTAVQRQRWLKQAGQLAQRL
ncbi:MAG: NAD(P)H-dependent oxidoreductase [Gammaproteobacteria bacterium]|nr:NAD(P)H-dependent oxidoreductase [Gammaproteobacteria bacterium]MBU1554413.1 NAD(P)H-dependent oxidoreductase [Gammaproteobacteria bacterium]MBU2070562.1 NAD(P)H-dependent oxidoreductase [Gammaproteobacteria bacterium]MBU2185374.1 NAD(P)H-dependent oxidoreductase [Gammaproteobacteria bacterium]MBU2207068.1 NAD(P)H-dependent oxidoreductase [Gammaproteobacteria bacterium]